jgi:hypothetical protein
MSIELHPAVNGLDIFLRDDVTNDEQEALGATDLMVRS